MNRSKAMATISSLALILAACPALFAQSQESGQFSGRITSLDGKPLAGATVLVRAPQLISPRVLKSDSAGNFRAVLLPPGEYTITVSLEGYKTQKTANPIRLGLGAQLHNDFQLKPFSVSVAEATVVVAASSATVDKSDPKVSVNFSAETLESLPANNRSFEGAADLASGVVMGPNGYGTTTIRGGKFTTAIYNIDGTTVGDEINGTSANTGTRYFVDDAIEDTQVILSPLHGRYGRTGSGVINAATKSGGNDFSGVIRTYLTRNDWAAIGPYGIGQTATNNDFYSVRHTDVFISGPIWKDKIWFALSTVKSPATTKAHQITLANSDPSTLRLTKDPLTMGAPGHTIVWATGAKPGTPLALGQLYGWNSGSTTTETDTENFYQGKLTWAITPDHTVQIERSYDHNI